MHRGPLQRVLVVLVLVAGAVVGAPIDPDEDSRPSIVWIIADDLSPDLSCEGTPAVYTPHIDRLAAEGVRFTNAYATAPVCSASRSALITGMYQTAIGAHNHRTRPRVGLPEGVTPIPTLLRRLGYHTANANATLLGWGKTDYNFEADGLYDAKTWAGREPGQPFFQQVQIYPPHRPFGEENSVERTEAVELPSYLPDHPVSRRDWANYLDWVEELDGRVGEVLDRLERDGLLDDTLVIFFGDHGRPQVRDKQWLYEGGIRVPLIMRWPGRLEAGTVDGRFVSLIDVGATTLALGGQPLPEGMHGVDILDPAFAGREAVFAAKDQLDETFDRVRSVRVGDMKYIRNFHPERAYVTGDQESRYKKLRYPVHTLMRVLHARGELTPEQALIFRERRPPEELFDLSRDPEELRNLAGDPEYRGVLESMRARLDAWIETHGDDGAVEVPAERREAVMRQMVDYYRKGMRERGLDPGVSDEDYLRYWVRRLGIED